MVPAYAEFHVLIVLFTTVLLLPKLTDKKLRSFLWILFIVYVLTTFEAFIGVKANLVRGLSIVSAILLFISLFIGRKIVRESPEKFTHIIKIFRFISILYMMFLVISVIANGIGMFALANYITKAVMVSLIFGVIVYLSIKVFTSLFILIFKFRATSNIQTFTALIDATHKRIRPLFNVVGFLFWLVFTLKGFELYDYILGGYNDIIAMEWRIGEMTISLGGILAFSGIVIVALIISKIAAALF